MKTVSLLFLWIAGACQVLVSVCAAADRPAEMEPAHLTGHLLQVGMDRGDGTLRELRDVEQQFDLLDGSSDTAGLWELWIRGDGTRTAISPADAGRLRFDTTRHEAGELRVTWEGFSRPGLQELVVEVTVRLDAEQPVSRWEIAVTKPPRAALEKVRFPRLGGIRQQEEECLAVPAWVGHLASAPRRMLCPAGQKGRRVEWSYPGRLSLQCAAWYRPGGPGLYLACDDTQARRKSLAFWGDVESQVCFEAVHEPEHQAMEMSRYVLPYRVLLGTFTGDWFTAAERYRAWASEQAWSRQSRLRTGSVPDWIADTGLWVWNRGRSEGVIPPAMALQKELGLPVRVFWHWWHGCAYDIGFPEYFPPREGTESFRAALDRGHEAGVRALVYMNQRLWGMSTASWTDEGAAAFAVKGTDGQIHPEFYNVFDRQPCAAMCLGTAFWRDKYAGLAVKAIRELGVDGIYMDQACSSLACYDASHAHPLGGGSYWMEGFHELTGEIRQRAGSGHPIALAGEGCGESWLESLDLMLTLQVSQERYATPNDGWEAIPFFHAVYHRDAVTFGSYSSLAVPPYDELWPGEFAPAEPRALLDRKYSRQFYLEQARAFVWGQQLAVANFYVEQLEQRAEELAYLVRLGRTRARGKKYLLHGTMLRTPDLRVPQAPVDFSRLSIYAGRRSGATEFQKECPLVLAAAWNAPDGRLGIALASIADDPVPLALRLDPREHRLPGEAKLVCIDESGRREIGRFRAADPVLRIELPPKAAWIVELEPE